MNKAVSKPDTSAQFRLLVRAVQNRHAGTKERGWKLISDEQMEIAERRFWRKRGFAKPPGSVSHCAVMA